MLPRILEPEVMDTAEEAHDYDSMDHSEVNWAFATDFLAAWDCCTGRILDAGTGTAQIPIELCQQSPTVHITAIDLSDHMLTLARRNVERAGLTNHITIEKADAKHFNDADGVFFGAVISNGIIHHIPEPFSCFAEMHRVCASGGRLFVRDLLRPNDEAALRYVVNTYAAGANDHQRQMFGDSLHAALTLAEVRGLVGRLGYPPESVQQTTGRHWTFTSIRS